MKLLFENWRRYLREGRTQTQFQRVLHDFGGYSGDVTRGTYDDEKTFRDKQKPSVGYDLSDDDVTKIKTEMEETPQDWMFITTKNVGAVGVFAKEKDKQAFQNWFDGWIKEWLENKNVSEDFLNNTIFLVIQSAPLKGDSTGAQWLIHDIIGHSIYYNYNDKTPSNYKPSFNLDFLNYVQQQINGTATADFDRLPDVFAAIILGNLGQEKMKEYGKNYLDSNQDNTRRGPAIRPRRWSPESVNDTITGIFDYTNWWVNKFLKRGPNNLNFVELWNPNDPNDK